MGDDPLDKKVSVGVELTETGLNASARSRAAAAIDRLVGNLVDFMNLPVEAKNVRTRTRIEGEKQLMDAMRDHAVGKMKTDAEFADRAITGYLQSIGLRQENKDSVARHAIEDLRRDPNSSDSAAPELDPAFLNRLERHAEDASTEVLREKWGRVLAAEIRNPGTVSPRVMRVVDEIDSSTAELFERFCESRLLNVVPWCLSGKLDFGDTTKLVGAGLLVEPGFGQVRGFVSTTSGAGEKYWFNGFKDHGVALPGDLAPPAQFNDALPVRAENGVPATPCYVLSDEGFAVSHILRNNEASAFERYISMIRDQFPKYAITVFSPAGAYWTPFRVISASDSSP